MSNRNNSLGEYPLERELGSEEISDLVSALKQLIDDVENADKIYTAKIELNFETKESIEDGYRAVKKGERVNFNVFVDIKRRA